MYFNILNSVDLIYLNRAKTPHPHMNKTGGSHLDAGSSICTDEDWCAAHARAPLRVYPDYMPRLVSLLCCGVIVFGDLMSDYFSVLAISNDTRALACSLGQHSQLEHGSWPCRTGRGAPNKATDFARSPFGLAKYRYSLTFIPFGRKMCTTFCCKFKDAALGEI